MTAVQRRPAGRARLWWEEVGLHGCLERMLAVEWKRRVHALLQRRWECRGEQGRVGSEVHGLLGVEGRGNEQPGELLAVLGHHDGQGEERAPTASTSSALVTAAADGV